MTDDIIWESNVGSHIWGMNHAESDIDLFRVYVRPTDEILIGNRVKSMMVKDKEKNIDYAIHEIGEVVHQIAKGNINFVTGLTSPIINQKSRWFYELYGTFMHNLSKNVYHSIRGMSISNYKKFIASELDVSKKKKKTIMRVIEFGIRFLREGKIEYLPPERDLNYADAFEIALEVLQSSYNVSSLPDRPDTRVYDSFLARLRKDF
jgi:predicted nucleotidyltransferase